MPVHASQLSAANTKISTKNPYLCETIRLNKNNGLAMAIFGLHENTKANQIF